jgi:flagellar protein FlaG
MKVDPSQLSSANSTLRHTAERITTGDDTADGNKVSTTKANHDGPVRPERTSRVIEIDNMRVSLQFKEDKETGIQVVQVVDPDSGRVVRQIPPEEILTITKALRDLKGLLVSRSF